MISFSALSRFRAPFGGDGPSARNRDITVYTNSNFVEPSKSSSIMPSTKILTNGSNWELPIMSKLHHQKFFLSQWLTKNIKISAERHKCFKSSSEATCTYVCWGVWKWLQFLVFSFPLLCSTTTHTTTLLFPRKCGIHKREKNCENTCKSGESFLLVFPRNGVAFELPAVTTRALCSYCVCQVKPLAEHRASRPREGAIGGLRLQKQSFWGILPQRFYKNSAPLL